MTAHARAPLLIRALTPRRRRAYKLPRRSAIRYNSGRDRLAIRWHGGASIYARRGADYHTRSNAFTFTCP
eukprot:13041622-Alexandrium_andersonii.AAC.1